MRQCVACGGLVPEAAEACPNCVVSRPLPFKSLVATVALAVSSSCYSCLPYGVPPCPDGGFGCYDPCNMALPDGGDPKTDPADSCFVDGGVDGGVP